jgi:RNA polymerase sigma factor (TIGR02999 family)
MPVNDPQLVQLLHDAQSGDAQATSRLLSAVYNELRALAAHQLQHERPGHTLQPTALAHEAYLKLLSNCDRSWNGRAHFLAAASQAMRRILVDHARAKGAVKRGGELQRVGLSSLDALPAAHSHADLVRLDALIEDLSRVDALAARVVEMRFFSGMHDEEIALAIGTSSRTVRRHWRYARAWLARALGEEGTPPGD